jgi:hypothetical protein
MRVRKTQESQLCAYTKNVLFSSSTLLDQPFLQFINKVLINYKDRWSNKSELENITFFVYAHNCDSGVLRTRMTLIGYGTSLIFCMNIVEKNVPNETCSKVVFKIAKRVKNIFSY